MKGKVIYVDFKNASIIHHNSSDNKKNFIQTIIQKFKNLFKQKNKKSSAQKTYKYKHWL